MNNLEEVRKDIAELQSFVGNSARPKVKDILNIEIHKLKAIEIQLENERQKNITTTGAPTTSSTSRCYQVKLNNYAWDQTDTSVKVFVDLKNVQDIPPENVFCNFTDRSLELNVKALENKDYILTIKNLLEPIVPASSSWKVKRDRIIITMTKTKSTHWGFITELEKKAKEAKMPKFDEDDAKDPSASLMNMMKKMYETGDDEMKRTIAKAWTENSNKNSELPSF